MAEAVFGNITLGSRGGSSQGSLKVSASGLVWKRSGGGRTVEVPTDEIKGLSWSKAPRGCLLAVSRGDAAPLVFIGFKDKDLEAIKAAGAGDVKEEPAPTSGRNWGGLEVEGSGLVFRVAGAPAFRLPLTELAGAQQGKDDVLLELPVDDTAAGNHEDTLVELSFHVPKNNPDWAAAAGADGAAGDAAKALYERLASFADAGPAQGEAVATFDQVGLLVPRGRFDVEFFLGGLKLAGQAQDFRIQYSSVARIFVLPKPHVPQVLVAVALDPPIRKGQTFYPCLLAQFPSEEEATLELDITDDQLAAKNEKCGGKLERSITGPGADVFARALRGLSGRGLTRPGSFRDSEGAGAAVRCSYKAEEGHLFPLERAFFYVQKPPLLIPHDDVDGIEFLRPAQGVTAAKTFDLLLRTRSGGEHLFRGIPRAEWTNLFEFIRAKKLRVENLREAERGPGAAAARFGEADAGLGGAGASSDDSGGEGSADEDFRGDEEESASQDSSSEGSEGGAPIAEEEPLAKKRKGEPKPAKEKPAKKEKKAEADEDQGSGKKARKPRKKKDKDAPKKGLSAFMLFSNDQRARVKEENPGIAFGEVGRVLGARWKELPAEERRPYEAAAARDKERYAEEMAAYKEKKRAEGAAEGEAEGSDGQDAGGDDAGAESA